MRNTKTKTIWKTKGVNWKKKLKYLIKIKNSFICTLYNSFFLLKIHSYSVDLHFVILLKNVFYKLKKTLLYIIKTTLKLKTIHVICLKINRQYWKINDLKMNEVIKKTVFFCYWFTE